VSPVPEPFQQIPFREDTSSPPGGGRVVGGGRVPPEVLLIVAFVTAVIFLAVALSVC
jgi:hypothetical protein